jgi:6-phosphogluconolactonase
MKRRILIASVLLLAGCLLRYNVGGTVTGLLGTDLVLADNHGHTVRVDADGTFTLDSRLQKGDAYAVTVQTQPTNPAQTCTVRNGTGTIDNAVISDVIVTCTQTGRFAYVANQLSNTISIFAINADNGALSAIVGSPYPVADIAPTALGLHPDGTFLYVTNNGSNTVAVFAIDPTTGLLTPGGFSAATGTQPVAIAIDPLARFAFVANAVDNTVSGYAISASSGLLAPITTSILPVGQSPRSLTINPDGNTLYIANVGGSVDAYVIGSDGTLSTVSGTPFAAGAGALAIGIDPTGSFAYVANDTAASISEYTVDGTSGALTAVAGSPLATTTRPQALAFDPAGTHLYAANVTADNQVGVFAIDATSGALSLQTAVAVGAGPVALTVDPAGQYLYVVNGTADTVNAFAIAADGSLSSLGAIATGSQPHAIVVH